MRWLPVEEFIRRGQAFVPVNAEGKGDVVKLIYVDASTELVDVHVETFLKHVLAFFGTDLLSLRRRYGPTIGKKQLIPLPLSNQYTLVPFNTRQPIGRQTCTGWVHFSKIAALQEVTPYMTNLQLQRYTLPVFHSPSFTHSQIRHARLIELEYLEVHRQLLSGQAQECRERCRCYSSDG